MPEEETPGRWTQAGERTWFLRLDAFGVNAGLVIGDDRAAVIDSGAGPTEAAQLHAAVRELTDLPLVLVNTHAHGDHFFGNAYFAAHGVEEIWAHARAVDTMAATGAEQRGLVETADPAMAAGEGEHTAVVLPSHRVEAQPVDLDLGGHSITLFHLGRGHTDGDLLVGSGTVLFAGDLVEEGADPSFSDSFPRQWGQTLGKIIAIDELYPAIVPGHGRMVDMDFVRTQLAQLRQGIRMCASAISESSADATKAIPILPYTPLQSRYLVERMRDTAGVQGA
ncbi:MBL fold metallo-hydrolase [Arthrobacter sp.]|uniref:MBL fold metallo-hydrolase n=1 Tax=Arthrobacter sp. TaxID=1667 RepID=UPI003A8D70AF